MFVLKQTSEGIVYMCFMVADVYIVHEEVKSKGYRDFKIKNNEVIYRVVDGYFFKVSVPVRNRN